jgi:hypothetical protein
MQKAYSLPQVIHTIFPNPHMVLRVGCQILQAASGIHHKFCMLWFSSDTFGSKNRMGTTRRLWMRCGEKILSSTPWQGRFRRSEGVYRPNYFSFHRPAHRLCTSRSTYSTTYPHPLGAAGLVALKTTATVAKYPFPRAKFACLAFASRLRSSVYGCSCGLSCG